MSTRYDDRRVFVTEKLDATHNDLLNPRGISSIKHYGTAEFQTPTKDTYRSLQSVNHIWKTGDRFYKLSHKYYGSTRYWWVIAKYNNRPTESHVRLGESLYIPMPLNDAIEGLRA